MIGLHFQALSLQLNAQEDMTANSYALLVVLIPLKFILQQRFGGSQGRPIDWQASPGSPSSFVVKRMVRIDIPVDRYPNVS